MIALEVAIIIVIMLCYFATLFVISVSTNRIESDIDKKYNEAMKDLKDCMEEIRKEHKKHFADICLQLELLEAAAMKWEADIKQQHQITLGKIEKHGYNKNNHTQQNKIGENNGKLHT